jgi:hypothetical protein
MSTPAGRQAELANLANAAGFLTAPFTAMANYVLTGQSPAQFFDVGDWRTAQGVRPGEEPRGVMPPGGIQGLLTGARNLLFGPQQPSVALGPMTPAVDSRAGITSFQNAYNLGLQYGLGEEASNAAGSAAASLVAQGIDPITAVTLAMQNASMAAAQMDMAGSPFDQPAMQGAAPQTMAQSMPGLAAMNQTLAQFAQGGPAAVADSGSYGGQSFADSSNAPAGSSSFDDASSGAYGYF